jgi:hypothetical protein
MNLYLLLAFAFGAVTAAADAPIVRAPRASVVLRSEARALTRRFAAPSPAAWAKDEAKATQRRSAAQIGYDAPLTGAASPRAPATIG